MKKVFLPLVAVGFLVASCGGSPCEDLSTPENAAECYCEKISEMEVLKEKDDKEAGKKLFEEMNEYEKTIKKNIEDGKYTEDELEKAAENVEGCDL